MTMITEAMMDYEPDGEVEADQLKRIRRARREANIDPEIWKRAQQQLKEIRLQVQLLEAQLFFAEQKNVSDVVPDRIDALYEFLSERQRFERALRSHKLTDEDAR